MTCKDELELTKEALRNALRQVSELEQRVAWLQAANKALRDRAVELMKELQHFGRDSWTRKN